MRIEVVRSSKRIPKTLFYWRRGSPSPAFPHPMGAGRWHKIHFFDETLSWALNYAKELGSIGQWGFGRVTLLKATHYCCSRVGQCLACQVYYTWQLRDMLIFLNLCLKKMKRTFSTSSGELGWLICLWALNDKFTFMISLPLKNINYCTSFLQVK